MNTTNIVIGIGIVGILYYKMKMAPAQPEGFTDGANWGTAYQKTCGTMGPSYGNDNQGTYTTTQPTEERSILTKDENSWGYGWGPEKGSGPFGLY